jgi:hypothetical protein
MVPRKKAGPNTWSPVHVLVSDQSWHKFATAIDRDASAANETRLPGGHTLRFGLQMAIEMVLSSEAGPTTREFRADLRNFIKIITNAYWAMRPETRDAWRNQWPTYVVDHGETVNRVLVDLDESDQDSGSSKQTNLTDSFLSDIIWLVGHCPTIRKSLPSKAHYDDADDYPLFRSARAAVFIASSLAERYAPTVAPKLKKIRNCQQSTLVSKLLRARRRTSFLFLVLDVIKAPAN